MASLGSLVVSLTAETAQFRADLGKSSYEAQKRFKEMQKSSQDLQREIRGLISTYVSLQTVQKIGQLADQYSRFTSQLKLATRSQEEYAAAYQNTIRIATSSQSDIESVGVLYARLANNLRDFGASQQEVADITEAIALTLRVSNASAAETSSVMLQLSQSFGSGILNGAEFNAVAEGAPALLRALAKELGVTYGELKKMGSEGKLTAQAMAAAWTNPEYLEGIRAQAKEVGTLGSGYTVMTNNIMIAIGEIDKMTGASKKLGQSMIDLSTSSGLKIFLQTVAVLGTDVAFVLNGIGKEIGGIAAQVGQVMQGNFAGAGAIRKAMVEDAKKARAELDAVQKKIMSDDFMTMKPAESSSSKSGGLSSPVKAIAEDAKKAKIEVNNLATETANLYADLFKDAEKLNQQENMSPADQLREKLQAIGNVDEATKRYIDTVIEQYNQDQFQRDLMRETTENLWAQAEAVEANRKAMQDRAKAIIENIDPTVKFKEQVDELNKLLDAGMISYEQYSKAAMDAQQDMLKFKDKSEEGFKDLERAIDGFSKNTATELADVFFGVETSFGDMINSILKDLARLAIQKTITDPLADLVTGAIKGGSSGSGGLGSFFSSFFSGGRAQGGRVIGGNSYLVGEYGPEVVTMGENGRVSQASGGGDVYVNVSVDASGSSVSGNDDKGKQLGNLLANQVKGILVSEMKPGGLLAKV